MGTTGSSAKTAMNAALPEIIARVKEYATVPLAVGFGVATRDHFNTVCDAGADGVVIGSRLVSVIKEAPKDKVPQYVQAYCQEISLKGQPPRVRPPSSKPTTPNVHADRKNPLAANGPSGLAVLPMRFGQFGGQYVPEALFDCLVELEEAHKSAMADPAFWKEFESYYGYMNRPSKLYFAESLTKHAGGAKIWLKREDL
jgi:tryptophan synthase